MEQNPDSDAALARAGARTDAALALAVVATLAALITFSGATSDTGASPLAFVFAAGFGAVLLLRRSMPLAVLALSVVATFAYYTLDLPQIGVAIPVLAALFAVAEAGKAVWAVAAAAIVFSVSLFFRLRDDPQLVGAVIATDSVSNLALMAAAIALGYGVRSRRLYLVQHRRMVELRARQVARDAEMRVQAERERISRDLHDTIGHALSVIALHSGVAAEARGSGDDTADRALARVREQSSDALGELRSIVRILREGDSPADSRLVHSISAVDGLVADVEKAGISVRTTILADPADVSPAVDTAAFRIVQEALTNIIRHSGAKSAAVHIAEKGGELAIDIRDDGRGAPETLDTGHGLAGMEERARLLGGIVTTHANDGGGLRIHARLPARLES